MQKPTLQKVHTGAAVALALAGIAPGYLLAADPPAGPAAPGFSDTLTAWGLSVSGYVAASYYASNGYPANIHQFDVEHNTFQLDQAGLQIAYQPKEGFGALVDLMAGEDARLLHAAEDGHDNTFDLRQAYVQYASGPLTVIGGKYVTLAGAEVINVTANTNFSRSLLFTWAEPLTHTGVRATYAVTDTFNIIAGVNNGWNSTSTSYGSKTGEAGLAWTPNKTFSLTTQAYFGKFAPATDAVGRSLDSDRTLIDAVATYNATSALTLVANVDYDKQDFQGGGSAKWYGAAVYVNYALNDAWRVSVRGEYLDDKDGFVSTAMTGGAFTGAQHIWEGTVTLGYAPTKNFELRLEGRYDRAQDDILSRSAGVLDSNYLGEFAIQGVYKFSAP